MGYNSTIKVKKKICKNCGKSEYIFSRGRCQQCAKVEDFKPIGKNSDNEFPDLVADIDALVSRYVRFKAADKDEQAPCFTCGTKKHWSELDCGHYIKREVMYLRFDYSRNLRPQCVNCNRIKHGNISEYTKRLELEKPGITDILYEESKMVYKYSREELKALVVELNQKLKQLHNERNG
jgi:hypothetical protein